VGGDIKQLRGRIRSVDSTLHLTKAMGLVASSKLRRAMEAMQASRTHTEALSATARTLSAFPTCRRSVFLTEREGGRTLLAVIAGDRGMAGGYNAGVFRLLSETPHDEVIAIGRRACDRLGTQARSAERFPYAEARELAETICRRFAAGEIDRFVILSTRYDSMLSQTPELIPVLPLLGDGEAGGDALFEPSPEAVLNALIPQYVAGMLYGAVRESFACEVAARRVAMDNAGKNATEMIEALTLQYNRARQSAITQEITEIVAGSGG